MRERKEFEELLAKNEKKRTAMSSNYINLTIAEEENPNRNKEILERIDELKKAISKRKTSEWKPESLLCKKFGVLDPYEHKEFHNEEPERRKPTLNDFIKESVMKGGKSEMNETKSKGSDGNLFFKEVQESFMEEIKKENGEEVNKEGVEKEEGEDENKDKQQQLVVSMEARPEISLFQSIFDD